MADVTHHWGCILILLQPQQRSHSFRSDASVAVTSDSQAKGQSQEAVPFASDTSLLKCKVEYSCVGTFPSLKALRRHSLPASGTGGVEGLVLSSLAVDREDAVHEERDDGDEEDRLDDADQESQDIEERHVVCRNRDAAQQLDSENRDQRL